MVLENKDWPFKERSIFFCETFMDDSPSTFDVDANSALRGVFWGYLQIN
jgi:hypothetical protein